MTHQDYSAHHTAQVRETKEAEAMFLQGRAQLIVEVGEGSKRGDLAQAGSPHRVGCGTPTHPPLRVERIAAGVHAPLAQNTGRKAPAVKAQWC